MGDIQLRLFVVTMVIGFGFINLIQSHYWLFLHPSKSMRRDV